MTCLAVAWVLVALGVAGGVGFARGGGSTAAIALSAFAPYLLGLALPALVVFLVCRSWWSAVAPFALLVVLAVVQVPRWVADDAGQQRHELVVMTANLKIGAADPVRLVRTVRERHVDVLMLEELTPAAFGAIRRAGLDIALRHHLARPLGGAAGTGLWSRYPLTAVDWPRLSFERVVARVAVPGVRVQPTVVALHVSGPIPKSLNWQLDLRRLPGMLAELPHDAPVVVGGDFNATRSVPQFRDLLTGGYADAADQAGAGGIRTYPSDRWFPPLLGIDHVLTRDAVGRSADTVTIPGSDHRALVVRVALH